VSKKTRIQTSIYEQPGQPGFICTFKVTWYQDDGEVLFTENIRPKAVFRKTREIAKEMLYVLIRTWLENYGLDWYCLDIRDKEIVEKLKERDIIF